MTKIEAILSYLDELLPEVGCELNYNKDYELLVAVTLSAQTTDKSVNLVTPKLWEKYHSIEELANAKEEDVASIIKSIGLYKAKAHNIVLLAKKIVNDFNMKVPVDKSDLMSLPGVGNKTAGVVRLELFNADEIPVDTHVARISKRLGLAKKSDEPLDIENKLKKAFPKERWGKLHHQLIHFGRYFCTAKNPNCKNCKISEFCREKTKI